MMLAILVQGIHEMGTAEWERDPKTSVLNAITKYGMRRMSFVTDGSLYDFCSSTESFFGLYGSDS